MNPYKFDLSCYKVLREQMREFRYNMYPFRFADNQENYFVAAYILTKEERESFPQYEYALFHFIFMKRDNLDDIYELYMNVTGIMDYNPTKLRFYFGIDFDPNGYGFMNRFCNALVEQCPQCVSHIAENDLIHVERHTLCKKLELDPEHCFRLKIMRLPKPKKRDGNRYQLACSVFPNATKMYANAQDVTYCFTDNPDEEVPEKIAIERFIKNENKRAK